MGSYFRSIISPAPPKAGLAIAAGTNLLRVPLGIEKNLLGEK